MGELSYLSDTVARQSRVSSLCDEIFARMVWRGHCETLPDWYHNGGDGNVVHCETDGMPGKDAIKAMVNNLAGHLDFKKRGVKNLCYGYFKDIPDTSGERTSAWLIGIEMGSEND